MKRIIFLLAFVFCITLLASQALAITVDFVPTHKTVRVGEKFVVYLHISGLEWGEIEDEKVGGFDIDIGFQFQTVGVAGIENAGCFQDGFQLVGLASDRVNCFEIIEIYDFLGGGTVMAGGALAAEIDKIGGIDPDDILQTESVLAELIALTGNIADPVVTDNAAAGGSITLVDIGAAFKIDKKAAGAGYHVSLRAVMRSPAGSD